MLNSILQIASKSEVCLACCFPMRNCGLPEDIAVNASPQYNRVSTAQSAIDIANEWARWTASNDRVYNKTKFRLDSLSLVANSGDASSKQSRLLLNLGITDYRDFLGTNFLHKRTKADAEEYLQSEMSDALGVAALLVSNDQKVVLQKRAAWCLEEPARWDVPGGHPEPSKLVGNVSTEEFDFKALSELRIREELFDSIRCEICDEVGIGRESISEPRLLGVFRNRRTCGKPSLHFIVQCSESAESIERVYNERKHAEADESTRIRFVHLDTVGRLIEAVGRVEHDEAYASEIALWHELTQSARAIFLLYSLSAQLSEPLIP